MLRHDLFLLAALIIAPCCAASASPAAPVDGAPEPSFDVVRAWFDDPARLDAISHLLGHAQIDRGKGLLRTEADAELRKALEQAGFRVETDAEATARVMQMQRAMSGDRSIAGYACYRTVEETRDDIDALAAAYPGLLAVNVIGQSWQSPGYALQVAVATNTSIPGPKPKLFMLSSIHAREYTPAELATRFIEDLVLGHGNDAEATWLLDHHEIHAVLQGNPDGRKRAETGLLWRKNHNTLHCGGGNSAGVDLNRNYPFAWGQYNGSSGDACSQTFRGPASASEPETQAIINYVREQFADMRGDGLNDPAPDHTQGMFLDIHSYSELVLWPWGFTQALAPNGAALAKLGRRLAWFNNYTAEQAIGLYATDGTTDDFAYGDLGLPAFTFELGTAFFQDCASFENRIYPDNTAALRYAARTLDAPYRLAFGPDAFDLAVAPDLVLPGQPVTVRATLDDSRQQTRVTGASGPVPPVQNVQAATAWLGIPPWQSGATAVAMQADDGSFDSPREIASTAIDTSGLAPGTHLLFVQGRDADGNDGAPNAAFVEVIAAENAVQLQGVVRQAGSGTALQADVRSGRFETQSDPATGAYSRLLRPGTFDLEVSAADHETAFLFGLPGSAGSTVIRNVELFQLCTLLEDPVEIGITSPLTAQLPWTRRTGAGNGGGAAWLQSASGNYANNINASLTSPVLDLDGYESPSLRFDSRCDTERNYDFGLVEISTNGGANWAEVFRCHGDPAWRSIELALPGLANAASARLRFRFTSDSSVTAPGWAVDNIRLRAGGPTCRAGQASPVAIDMLMATPASITAGDSSMLVWSTRNALSCVIANDIDAGVIAIDPGELGSGQREVAPIMSTNYTLQCEGEQGPATASAAVTVTLPPPVAILAFSASPERVIAGDGSTLSWLTEHATDCLIDNDSGLPAIVLDSNERDGGTRQVFPAIDTVYTLQCDGNASQAQQQVQLAVVGTDLFKDGFEETAVPDN
jgi:carboxypeptidase T